MVLVSMGGEMLSLPLEPAFAARLLLLAYVNTRMLGDVAGHEFHGNQWSDLGALTKVGGQKGSNEGGTYVDKSGQKYYVKNYKDPSQAVGEHVANAVYRAVGAKVPETTLGPNGQLASKWMGEAGHTLGEHGVDKATANKVLDHFAADVLTANWDAVGTGHDNILVSKSGEVTRVDQGGTLLHRAQGALKPESALHGISEWDRLSDRHTNPYYAKVFHAAGVKNADALGSRAVAQVAAIDKVRPKEGWRSFVEKHAPNAPKGYAEKAGKVLESRHALLRAKVASLKALEWDESLHPRDEHGKFGQGDGVKKEKAKPATKEQIAKAVELKKLGHSYAHIEKHTGLNPKQAATIVHKHNKAEAALKEKAALAGPQKATAADVAKASGLPTPPPPGPSPFAKSDPYWAKDYSKGNEYDKSTGTWVPKGTAKSPYGEADKPVTAVKLPAQIVSNTHGDDESAGHVLHSGIANQSYTWQEKTTANSPGANKENLGKFAYFDDHGKQVSAPFAKTDYQKAQATIHQGKGADYVKPAVTTPTYQGPQYHVTHEPGGAVEVGTGKWPIANDVDRKLGTATPAALTASGNTWANSLTSKERSAIEDYTKSSYQYINSELYHGGAIQANTSAAHIASALAKAPSPPPPALVWRGLSNDGAKQLVGKLKAGDKITIPGFQSTSIKPEFANSWGGGHVVFEIKPTKGAYIRPLSSFKHEQEYLLPHNASYRVHAITTVKLAGTSKSVVQLEQL
jgi:hypothetical protein